MQYVRARCQQRTHLLITVDDAGVLGGRADELPVDTGEEVHQVAGARTRGKLSVLIASVPGQDEVLVALALLCVDLGGELGLGPPGRAA
jgi:hypothetical protein